MSEKCLITGLVTPKFPYLCSPCLFTLCRGVMPHLNIYINQISISLFITLLHSRSKYQADTYSGEAKVLCYMLINMENKDMGLLALYILITWMITKTPKPSKYYMTGLIYMFRAIFNGS